MSAVGLKDRLSADIKAAMLARDSFVTDTLKGLKAAILNEEIQLNKRDVGLSDAEIETLFAREAKKRLEAAALYESGANKEMAQKERQEHKIILGYLPKQLDEKEIQTIIAEVIQSTSAKSIQDMGKVIGGVKAKTGTSADGAVVARLVKDALQ